MQLCNHLIIEGIRKKEITHYLNFIFEILTIFFLLIKTKLIIILITNLTGFIYYNLILVIIQQQLTKLKFFIKGERE